MNPGCPSCRHARVFTERPDGPMGDTIEVYDCHHPVVLTLPSCVWVDRKHGAYYGCESYEGREDGP